MPHKLLRVPLKVSESFTGSESHDEMLVIRYTVVGEPFRFRELFW